MKQLFYILILVLLSGFVTGATVHGNIYSYELNLNRNSIVTVDTTPRQTVVAKDGLYSFELEQGTYGITAFERINNITISSVTETVVVDKEGDYTVDLILFPLIEEEEVSDLDLSDVYTEKDYSGYIIGIGLIVVGLVIAIFAFIYYKKFLKRKKEIIEVKSEDLADKVLEFIKQEKRVTQKEIRKKFPMSEAKISLVISELVHKNKIEKIKKGRGNIIILK